MGNSTWHNIWRPYRGLDFERRQKQVNVYRTIVCIIFLLMFIVSPLVQHIKKSVDKRDTETAEVVANLSTYQAQYKALEHRVHSSSPMTRDEYVYEVNLLYNLARKFELVDGHYEARRGLHHALIIKLFKSEQARGWESAMGRNMKHVGHSWDESDELSEFMMREAGQLNRQVPALGPITNDQWANIGIWLGTHYLLFLPFGLLLLIGNLYLYGYGLKEQLVFGFWRAVLVAPLGFIAVPFFGECNYYEQRLNKVRRKLFPDNGELSPSEQALVIKCASEPLERVDNSIRQGKLAVAFGSLLAFLSLPMFGFGKPKADDGKKKAESSQVEDSLTTKEDQTIEPPKVSGQFRIGYSSKTKETNLKAALVNVSGFHIGKYEMETDLATGKISTSFFMYELWKNVNLTAGRFKSEWLAFAPPPHVNHILGQVRAGQEVVGRETGIKLSGKVNEFSYGLDYSGSGRQRINLRTGYNGSVVSGNVLLDVALNGGHSQKLAGNVALKHESSTLSTMVVWKKENSSAITGVVQAGHRILPNWYLFLLVDYEVDSRPAWLMGTTFAPHEDIVFKGNYVPAIEEVLLEASYRF